jgi:hypothetical protein
VGGDCDDSWDNDLDGLLDYPADPGCSSPSDFSEYPECDDGDDNDGDGLVDYPNDPGCRNLESNNESPQCEDGIDNDGDGFIDYPDDGQCGSAYWDDESSPGCGLLGVEALPVLLAMGWVQRRRFRM